MKNSYRMATVGTVVLAVLLLAAVPGAAQPTLPKDPEERTKAIARLFQTDAKRLTLFDRQGNETAVGARDLYFWPALSPDGKRLAVLKRELAKENYDLWILEVGTGKATKITSGGSREGSISPAWSPDGNQIAYVALRQGRFGLYRTAANGEGTEELLYASNAPPTLTDWSMDGRYLTYFTTDLSGGALFALPLDAAGERKPIEMYRSTFQIQNPRLSPDSRFLAYESNESGKNEVYVRRFNPTDPAAGASVAPAERPWRISEHGAAGLAFWRRDGRELSFAAADRRIMSVPVTTSPTVEFGKPKLLFRLAAGTQVNPWNAGVNRDTNRFVIALPATRLRQITVFDRRGKVLNTVGQPGVYRTVRLSPDGKRLALVRNDPQTGNDDISTVDMATGKGTTVTNDTPPDDSPVWSPDGAQVAYVSTRQSYSGIYRKAADGTGEEKLLFRYTPGAGMILTDWSSDGKFLTFSNGMLLLVPLRPEEQGLDRRAIEWLREDYDAERGTFSPDQRFLAFLSNEGEADALTLQVYVRPFDGSKPAAPSGPAVKVSGNKGGADGTVSWRHDGKELYFMTRDGDDMAVDVATTPAFQVGTPRILFKLPGLPVAGSLEVSPDGERFVYLVPAPARPTR